MAKEKQFRNYDQALQVRITKKQLDLFHKAAAVEGRTLSNWGRYHLEKIANRVLKK